MTPHADPDRRAWLVWLASTAGVAASALMAGCASSAAPRWHRLPLDEPGLRRANRSASDSGIPAAVESWELARDIGLPEYLQRDTLLVDEGAGRLRPLPLDRWAEPLQDAVPRLLLHDLQHLRGVDRIWPAPAPASAGAGQRLRVQVLALEAQLTLAVLVLQARCTWQPAAAGAPTRVRLVRVEVPLASAEPGALVQAHRAAIARLAEQLSAGA